jgi:NADH dehydrogenase
MDRRAVVTGAFSYIGAAVASELCGRGWQVHTLTRRHAPSGETQVTASDLRFDAEYLEQVLRNADAFVNTYWIRFPQAGQDFGTAVERSRQLIGAAKRAGVRRLVHVSVSNAALDARLGYYRGKALVEDVVRAARMSFAIVRPTLVVGPSDVLTSNIAWFLRRFPVFPLPKGGHYRLQPVTLGDTGRIVADAIESHQDLEVDAAGPDVLSFRQYVRLVAKACGVRRLILAAPAWLSFAALRLVEAWLHDVVLTREELDGLEQELLVSRAPALGRESVGRWLLEHGAALGRSYVNDRERHFGLGRSQPILIP